MARTMSVDLSMTISAAVPRPLFSATSASKSISTVSHTERGSTGVDEPPGIPAGMALDQLLHRDRHRLFDIARLVHVAGNAEDFRAGVARPADRGEPRRAALEDRRRDGDGLDVVDRRRAAVEPDLGRERRLQPRLALAPLEAFEQAGLLAA